MCVFQAWFNYVDEQDGRLHQMWFDDPQSLRLKYATAAKLGIGGVGPYEFSDLDYGNSTAAKQQAAAMWAALKQYRFS